MYFKVTTVRALTALLFLLSLSCSSSKEEYLERCADVTGAALEFDPVEFEIAEGIPALNAAALLGTSLALNENSRVPRVSRHYNYPICSDGKLEKVEGVPVPETEPCGIAAFNSCGSGVSLLDERDCTMGAFEMTNYSVRLETLNAGSLPYCPMDWDHFLTSNSSLLVKHFNYSGQRGFAYIAATTSGDVAGWDYRVQLSPTSAGKYGIKLAQSTSGRALKIHGARIKSFKYWDQTFSSENLKISAAASNPMKFIVDSGSQEIAIQENYERYTAKLSVSGLTWDLSGCGCIPESGQITTHYSGSRSGIEVITFEDESESGSCGSYKLEEFTADGHSKGEPRFGTLNYCL